ncbi:MAG: hypothetical protein QOI08_1248 [Actinomycetota bacterium]|nr:hypothetical protein [Actinomycetota bacterium]
MVPGLRRRERERDNRNNHNRQNESDDPSARRQATGSSPRSVGIPAEVNRLEIWRRGVHMPSIHARLQIRHRDFTLRREQAPHPTASSQPPMTACRHSPRAQHWAICVRSIGA